MNEIPSRKIKTGTDPRTLPDYAALRDELAKLSHPARPDVNWHYVEKLCLSLFEQNGVELQTAAWYTLARTQRAGLLGLNEGLAILEALMSHHWGALWPQPVHARMEILSGLSQRIQQLMRTLPLNYSDLSQLYHAEQQLNSLGAVLQRLELKHLSQFDTLQTLMHNSAVRLENSDGVSDSNVAQPGIVLPATVMNSMGASGIPMAEKNEPENRVKWVYVAQPEQQPNVDVLTEKPAAEKNWKLFAAGMVTMLAISVATVWGWQYLHRPDPLQTQLVASLAPFPSVLSGEQLEIVHQQTLEPKNVLNSTQQQLTRLQSFPPDWPLAYGQQLVHQLQTLKPASSATQQLAQAWQQQLTAAALPAEAMNGWFQGMEQLRQLSQKLNGLDEKRGKYMTVSELKSVVYSTTQEFSRTVPIEEQLRRYAASPSDIQLRQLEMTLDQLQKRYFLLKQGAAVSPPTPLSIRPDPAQTSVR